MRNGELTWQWVEHWAEKTPDAEAIVFESRRITYAQLREQVDAAARAFIAAGVGAGDRVAMLAAACPEFLITFMAANKIGAIWLGLSPKFALAELDFVMGDAQPALLIALRTYQDRDLAEEVVALAQNHPCIKQALVLGDAPAGCTNFDEFVNRDRAEIDSLLDERAATTTPDDGALLLYTSGSTGKPKGVLLSHRNVVTSGTIQNKHFHMDPMRPILHFPINHVAATVEIGFANLQAGGACVMLEAFDPAKTLALIERERITMLGQVPTMFLMEFGLPQFTTTDFSSVQGVIWGGSSAPKRVLDGMLALAARHGARVMTGYGATEMSGFVTFTHPDDPVDTLTWCAGRCAPEYALRIVDDQRNPLPAGSVGEIAVRGPVIFQRYWNRPDLTRTVLDDDGWYYSGDLGSVDEAGRLRISGRKTEMFKTGGENVYPREIEDVLEQHPAVLIAAVVSVPDDTYQEVGWAAVMPHPGHSPSPHELEALCRDRLANFKVPKRIAIWPVLPLLPNGKVNKVALKSQWLLQS